MTHQPQSHRDIPRLRHPYRAAAGNEPAHPQPPQQHHTTRRHTRIRYHGFTQQETEHIHRTEHHHRRGIPILGPNTPGGNIPNTRPGHTTCTQCGAQSGQWHRRRCDWTGQLP